MWSVETRAIGSRKYKVVAKYLDATDGQEFSIGPFELDSKDDIVPFAKRAVKAMLMWKNGKTAENIDGLIITALERETP